MIYNLKHSRRQTVSTARDSGDTPRLKAAESCRLLGSCIGRDTFCVVSDTKSPKCAGNDTFCVEKDTFTKSRAEKALLKYLGLLRYLEAPQKRVYAINETEN